MSCSSWRLGAMFVDEWANWLSAIELRVESWPRSRIEADGYTYFIWIDNHLDQSFDLCLVESLNVKESLKYRIKKIQ